MATEYCPGGELFSHLRKSLRFTSQDSRFYAAQVGNSFKSLPSFNIATFCTAQIVMFLEYIHSQDIVYRDIKPENVLLTQAGYVKMCDFGFSKKVAFKTYTFCGTPEYMARGAHIN